jgi:hypothetical protein
MNVLSILTEFMEESKIAHDPFTIEQLITGAVVIWNIPSPSCDILEKLIKDDIRVENIKALKILMQNNLTSEESPYTIYTQNAMIGDRANMRLHLQYSGPKLRKKISGIKSSKEETKALLHSIVKNKVDKYKLSEAARMSQRIKVDKPVNVAFQSRFVKLVGRHTAHEMVFSVSPTRKDYLELVGMLMPKMINNIIVTPVSANSTSIAYRMNAAGKPYLVKIGAYLDEKIAIALRKP